MTDIATHRQLLNAAKALLHRLEYRAMTTTWFKHSQEDYRVIVQAQRAIEDSKRALEIGSESRKPIHFLPQSRRGNAHEPIPDA